MIEARDAIHLMLHFRPGGADPELQPSTREVVDCYRDLGQQRRVTVRIAGDHAAKAHALRGDGHRCLERPALEHRPIWPPGADRRQMVEDPHMVEARLVGDSPHPAQFLDCGVLSAVLDSKTHRMSHVQITVRATWQLHLETAVSLLSRYPGVPYAATTTTATVGEHRSGARCGPAAQRAAAVRMVSEHADLEQR